MSKITDESFVTLATNDSYVMGALTLAHSLKNVNTSRSLSIMITNSVSFHLQELLRQVFDHVEVVNILDSNDSLNLTLLNRPDLGVTFTKLHCWRLVNFKKCVFLDADCLVLKNVDDLFEREEFSAAADVGWPDCFNSGVFVFKPSLETYSNLLKFAIEMGSFDGGDQGLLNSYFNNWSTSESSRRLPFIYNMTTNVSYTYAPAYKNFKDTVKIVHFIGANKPWKYTFNLDSNSVEGQGSQYEGQHVREWWSIFTKFVLSHLDAETLRINLRIIQTVFNTQSAQPVCQSYHEVKHQQASKEVSSTTSVSSDGIVIGSEEHKNLWQTGKIEYTGRDSFSNIQAHLDAKLNQQ